LHSVRLTEYTVNVGGVLAIHEYALIGVGWVTSKSGLAKAAVYFNESLYVSCPVKGREKWIKWKEIGRMNW